MKGKKLDDKPCKLKSSSSRQNFKLESINLQTTRNNSNGPATQNGKKIQPLQKGDNTKSKKCTIQAPCSGISRYTVSRQKQRRMRTRGWNIIPLRRGTSCRRFKTDSAGRTRPVSRTRTRRANPS